ncbi:MAG: DUF481 domain-containing protein, partial [Armatimonadota bacterium]
MLRDLVTPILGLAVTSLAFAAPDDKPVRFDYHLNFGLSAVQSATNSQAFSFTGDAVRKNPGVDALTFDAGYFNNRQTDPNTNTLQDTQNYWFFGGRYDRVMSPRLSWYAGARFNRDGILGLDMRQLYSVGLGYLVSAPSEDPIWAWTLSGGVSHIQEKYSSGDSNSST